MINFDTALPILSRIVAEHLGAMALREGVVVRDVSGRLAFVSKGEMPKKRKQALEKAIRSGLGRYARNDRVLADKADFGAEALLSDAAASTVDAGIYKVRLIDRRMVGADWLRSPQRPIRGAAVIVFGSIKGGVGRSTALSVIASDQARQGRRVLAVDLDLEAPGVGSMLLNDATTPEFGVLDAFVEMQLGADISAMIPELIGPSSLAARNGKIDVLPAFGRRSIENPGEILAKLARAYADVTDSDGKYQSFLDRVRATIQAFTASGAYDVVLVDARAGLHESTAAAVAGLGAEVLLFGLDEPQTYQGYSALFGHMTRYFGNSAELVGWAERITMVEGKRRESSEFTPEVWTNIFSNVGSLSGTSDHIVTLPAEPFHDVPWDEEALLDSEVQDDPTTLKVVSIEYDARFRGFDPMRRSELLGHDLYRAPFGKLLELVDQMVKTTLAEGAV